MLKISTQKERIKSVRDKDKFDNNVDNNNKQYAFNIHVEDNGLWETLQSIKNFVTENNALINRKITPQFVEKLIKAWENQHPEETYQELTKENALVEPKLNDSNKTVNLYNLRKHLRQILKTKENEYWNVEEKANFNKRFPGFLNTELEIELNKMTYAQKLCHVLSKFEENKGKTYNTIMRKTSFELVAGTNVNIGTMMPSARQLIKGQANGGTLTKEEIFEIEEKFPGILLSVASDYTKKVFKTYGRKFYEVLSKNDKYTNSKNPEQACKENLLNQIIEERSKNLAKKELKK